MPNDLIEIARFHSSADAAIARNCLDDADIPACLTGEAMASWFWYLGSAIGGVKLLVNHEDVERASAVLSTPSPIIDDDSIDFGDDAPKNADDQEDELSTELVRAFRAAIIGMFLLPPLLNMYSTYLLIRHRFFPSSRNWQLGMTICANCLVFLVGIAVTCMFIAPDESSRTFSTPLDLPIELEPVEGEIITIQVVP